MKKSLVVMSLVALSSCGFRTGFLRDSQTLNQIDVRLDASSVQLVRQARGTHNIGMLFCTIQFGDAHYASAMEDLMTVAHLGPNEILMNYREDNALTTYLGFWCNSQLTISADVVRITPSAPGALPLR